MTDEPEMDPTGPAGYERLCTLAKSLDESDFRFDVPPPGLWAAIESEAIGATPLTRSARRRTSPLLLVAACIVLVAGLAAVAALRTGSTKTRVLASAALSNEGLSPIARTSHGTARLEQRDGQQFLIVEVDDAPPTDGSYLEIWLIDRKVEGMVSLGPYHGNGRYDIPPGVDPTKFPVVDVSIEPVDGKPVHSGVSAVRGVLE